MYPSVKPVIVLDIVNTVVMIVAIAQIVIVKNV